MKLMTRDPVNGNRHFEGRLKAFHDGRLSLELTERKKSKKSRRWRQGTEVEIELATSRRRTWFPSCWVACSKKSSK